MPTVEEAYDFQSPLNADLRAGIDNLSQMQEVTFTQYVQLVLPFDNFIFWVRSDLISLNVLLNIYNLGPTGNPPNTFTVKGSLHYATDQQQAETHTYAINQVVFTAEEEVQPFNAVNPQTLWIAKFGAVEGIRFAFSGRKSLYRPQAGIFHYTGHAIYSDMETQIVDDVSNFSQRKLIVSNSLPLWLIMNVYASPVPGPLVPPGFRFYPSYAAPDNLEPPFGTVHVEPDSTMAIGAAPLITSNATHYQLAEERVKLTTFGLNNDQAQDLMDFIFQFTLYTEAFGVMNMPILRDEKRTQRELLTLSQMKTAEFRVNYYQQRIRHVVRQLIESAIPTVTPKAPFPVIS